MSIDINTLQLHVLCIANIKKKPSRGVGETIKPQAITLFFHTIQSIFINEDVSISIHVLSR